MKMEKSKKEVIAKVLATIGIIVLMVGVICAMFAISIPTGIATIVFYLIGKVSGYYVGYKKKSKMLKSFIDNMLENREDFFAGKLITFEADDDTIYVHVSEVEKEEPKETEEKAEKKKKK